MNERMNEELIKYTAQVKCSLEKNTVSIPTHLLPQGLVTKQKKVSQNRHFGRVTRANLFYSYDLSRPVLFILPFFSQAWCLTLQTTKEPARSTSASRS